MVNKNATLDGLREAFSKKKEVPLDNVVHVLQEHGYVNANYGCWRHKNNDILMCRLPDSSKKTHRVGGKGLDSVIQACEAAERERLTNAARPDVNNVASVQKDGGPQIRGGRA